MSKERLEEVFNQLNTEELRYLSHAMECIELCADMSDDMEKGYEETKEIRELIRSSINACLLTEEEKSKEKEMEIVLRHILEEQLAHGVHGDAEYIRMIEEVLYKEE